LAKYSVSGSGERLRNGITAIEMRFVVIAVFFRSRRALTEAPDRNHCPACILRNSTVEGSTGSTADAMIARQSQMLDRILAGSSSDRTLGHYWSLIAFGITRSGLASVMPNRPNTHRYLTPATEGIGRLDSATAVIEDLAERGTSPGHGMLLDALSGRLKGNYRDGHANTPPDPSDGSLTRVCSISYPPGALLAVAVLCAVPCAWIRPSVAGDSRPNVLQIVCDDLNTHVSTSGYPHISTPAFDELAAAGMSFTRAYCQYPVCNPSRTSFLHGLYPQSTGVIDNTLDIRQTRPGTVSMQTGD
jgi:hypothetical protein